MESAAKIRRLYFVQGMSIKALSRKTGISRNTIRGIIRSDSASRQYKRVEQPMPKLQAYIPQLEDWLRADVKSPKKQRPTAMNYFNQLVAKGYDGGYDSVRRFIKGWRTHQQSSVVGAYIPLSFSPGEAYQFDWSEEVVELGGVTQAIKVAHFRLCYSRKFLVIAYFREKQEMLFDAHDRAFKFFSGLCKRGIYDNMKTAVKSVFVGKERVFNARFLSLMDHYLIEPTACTPAAGWEKGQVENQVDNVRDWLFKPRLKYPNIEALNEYLAQQCQIIADKRKHPTQPDKTIEEMFQSEKIHLRPLPDSSFANYNETHLRVSSTCLVNFDRNKYSVDCAYANQVVVLRAYATRIEIMLDNQLIAEHARSFSRGRVFFSPWHYVPLLARKPGALRNGAPFKEWVLPKPIQAVKDKLLNRKGGDRECADILMAMVEYGVEAVSVACDLALSDKTVNRDHVINILNRLQETPTPEAIDLSESLTLKHEPIANCQQYNQLLQHH